jgi:hypothetical protein
MTKKPIVAGGVVLFLASLTGCSGMKVIHPNDVNKDAGTKMLDLSGGTPRIVSTYTCKLLSVDGTRLSALGKTEADACKEVLAKCRDKTLMSVCKEDKVTCVSN